MTKYDKYIKSAKELGVSDAKIIPADTVVTAEWVLLKCKFGCGGYGRRLTCPPNSPGPKQTKEMLTDYKIALLIHTDQKHDINKIVPVLEKEIFFDGYHKAFGIGSGPCLLCKECAKFCKYPHEARPAMEACGIDVFTTVRAHGLPIEVVNTKNDEGNYYGIILIE